MTRNAILGAAALGAVVLVAAVLAHSRGAPAPAPDAEAEGTSRHHEQVREFWDRYRAATRLRIARSPAEAAAAYVAALELDDRHEDALYYLGNMYLELGRYAEAERSWVRLVEVNPNAARAHARLGDLRFCFDEAGMRDSRAAAAAYQRALQVNREQVGPLVRLGQLALLEGRSADAAAYFAAVLATHATSEEAHYFAGYLAWRAGDRVRAGEHFERALATAARGEPGDPLIGEGDTRAGSAPLVAEHLTCPAVQAKLEAFRSNARPAGIDESYRTLEANLASLRSGGSGGSLAP